MSALPSMPPAAVFFDLDGTLADTSADLAAPVNAMRVERGLPPMPVERLRPFTSMGARGLLAKGLDVHVGHPDHEALRQDFLRRYEARICVDTHLFEGMARVLDALDAAGIPWGVVSNKFERYVRPILGTLGLMERSRTAIGGDTASHAKPHPAPLLHAAAIVGVEPARCVYVGDDLRDVQAAHAAGMQAVVAAYGFCGEELPPAEWGGDALIERADALLDVLGLSAD